MTDEASAGKAGVASAPTRVLRVDSAFLARERQSVALEVISGISPRDDMFVGNEDHYFQVGGSALESIAIALAAAGTRAPNRILDLPCGHGRVMRALKAGYPEAAITGCDLDRDGVDFCAKTFGAAPVYGSEDPSDIRLDQEFDLIWCGSLLTHLDAGRWTQFLALFERSLAPGGVLVFTTNGSFAQRLLRTAARKKSVPLDGDQGFEGRYERLAAGYFPLPPESLRRMVEGYATRGFGYANYVDDDNYGQSVSSPAWVCRRLESLNVRLLVLAENRWDSVQDVVACTLR